MLYAETMNTLRHIFTARADNATDSNVRKAWKTALDLVEYANVNNYECLAQFDYLMTDEEKEAEAMAERESLGNNWW